MTRIVSLIILVVLLISTEFTVWEFTVSKQTGLANGQTVVWSVADEKFFDELAKHQSQDNYKSGILNLNILGFK